MNNDMQLTCDQKLLSRVAGFVCRTTANSRYCTNSPSAVKISSQHSYI